MSPEESTKLWLAFHQENMNMSSNKLSTVACDIFCEFLEVAFNMLLYVRNLYPSGIFERRQKYNIPVQMCCHPGVNDYLKSLLKSLKHYVDTGAVEQVVFCIHCPVTQNPIERFVFEISGVSGDGYNGKVDAYLSRLEQTLRAFMLKLNICDSFLNGLPDDCTWSVQLYTKEETLLDVQSGQCIDDFQWVQVDEKENTVSEPTIVPIKSLDSEVMKIHCYVEESPNK